MSSQLLEENIKLSKRVEELEKQILLIKEMEKSERVKKYIEKVERSLKITNLFENLEDNQNIESVNSLLEEKISKILSEKYNIKSLEEAQNYIQNVERLLAKEECYLDDIVDHKNWGEIFEYQKTSDGVIISQYIGFDEEEVVIPNFIEGIEVIEIGDSAFQNCEAIKKVVFPQFLKKIGNDAFEDCGLEELILPKSLASIGENAFSNTKIKEVVIPDGIERIENYTFSSCFELSKVFFPESLISIGQGAFLYCQSLMKVDIPCNCKIIEQDAFMDILEEDDFRDHFDIRFTKGIESIGIDSSIESVFGAFPEYNITFYCEAGSYAMKYARKYKINIKKYEEFEELD